jgi:hypothetical protein
LLANQLLGIPATNRLGVEVTILVDIRDDQPDLIGMSGQHDPSFGFGIGCENEISVQVGFRTLHEGAAVLADHPLYWLFETGNARSSYKPVEKLTGVVIHES